MWTLGPFWFKCTKILVHLTSLMVTFNILYTQSAYSTMLYHLPNSSFTYMAVVSGWEGRVLAWPLFHWPNRHMHTVWINDTQNHRQLCHWLTCWCNNYTIVWQAAVKTIGYHHCMNISQTDRQCCIGFVHRFQPFWFTQFMVILSPRWSQRCTALPTTIPFGLAATHTPPKLSLCLYMV